jgi:hypothetical protein
MYILWVKKRKWYSLWSRAYTGTEQDCYNVQSNYKDEEYHTRVLPIKDFA